METRMRPPDNVAALSSSPAFGTPLHPILPAHANQPLPPLAFKPSIPAVLPILLPSPTLRPLAFRTFTKKHNLTLASSALQALATFIGRHCGSGWRDEGSGEKVLEEVARLWKAEGGPLIVEENDKLRNILQTLAGCMTGGRLGLVRTTSNLSRQSSFAFGNDSAIDLSDSSHRPSLENRNSSFGLSSLYVTGDDDDNDEETSRDPRAWFRVVAASDQPRFSYDMDKKHYVQVNKKPSMFPSPSHKTALFRERYNIIHQRILRNEAFQGPSFASRSQNPMNGDTSTTEQFYKLTSIANLLGRGGTSHLLLGMLVVAPTGILALNDLTGSISLDLQHASTLQEDNGSYFVPGMMVLVDGVYEEGWAGAGSSGLGNTGGVGGTIGGRFIGFNVGGPPVERRDVSMGVDLASGDVGGGFGWTDFLGLGSERAVGSKMKRIERKLLGQHEEGVKETRRKMVMLAEVTLDKPQTLSALRKVLEHYANVNEAPMAFLLTGNFCSRAAMAGARVGSIEYKEMFNELAAVLSDFPALLRESTWVFVPGDNDPWSSAFSAGASALVPKDGIPDIFTSRIKRTFASAKSESASARKDALSGEAVWTSNPTRLSFFGPIHELVVFRDDTSGRFRRNAIKVGQTTTADNAPRPQQDDIMSMAGALPSVEDIAPEDTQMIADDSPRPEALAEDHTIAQAKKLILSLLPQSTLSPFSLNTRPVHWDLASSAMSLFPLPHTLVLADAETPPFAMTYEGCHVINPGRLVEGSGRRRKVQWCEYDVLRKRGALKESWID